MGTQLVGVISRIALFARMPSHKKPLDSMLHQKRVAQRRCLVGGELEDHGPGRPLEDRAARDGGREQRRRTDVGVVAQPARTAQAGHPGGFPGAAVTAPEALDAAAAGAQRQRLDHVGAAPDPADELLHRALEQVAAETTSAKPWRLVALRPLPYPRAHELYFLGGPYSAAKSMSEVRAWAAAVPEVLSTATGVPSLADVSRSASRSSSSEHTTS